MNAVIAKTDAAAPSGTPSGGAPRKPSLVGRTGSLSAALKNATAVAPVVAAGRPDEIDIDAIVVRPQIRQRFDAKKLQSLADSIKLQGIRVALQVNEFEPGKFELIAGERRLRASIMAGKKTVPVMRHKELPDFEKRQIQIAENYDREDLSLAEEAQAVAADVEKYGSERASQLWSRDAAWISKRVSVTRYEPITRALLDEDVITEIETLHSLNQLERLDAESAQRMAKAARDGERVRREDVRQQVARLKEARRGGPDGGEAQAPAAQVAAEQSATVEATPAQAQGAPRQTEAVQTEPAAEQEAAVAESEASAAEAAPQAPEASAAPVSAPAAVREAEGVSQRAPQTDAQRLTTERAQMYRAGLNAADRYARIRAAAPAGIEGKWITHSAALDAVLPVLEAMGEEGAVAFAESLVTLLASQSAGSAMKEIHPVVSGARETDPEAVRVEVPQMPAGWGEGEDVA